MLRFQFCEGWALCFGAKPKVPFVKIVFLIMWVGKKNKTPTLSCHIGKKSAVKFICRPGVSIIFYQFNECCLAHYACLKLDYIRN